MKYKAIRDLYNKKIAREVVEYNLLKRIKIGVPMLFKCTYYDSSVYERACIPVTFNTHSVRVHHMAVSKNQLIVSPHIKFKNIIEVTELKRIDAPLLVNWFYKGNGYFRDYMAGI